MNHQNQNRKTKEYHQEKKQRLKNTKQDPKYNFENPRKDLKFPEMDFLEFKVYSQQSKAEISLKTYRFPSVTRPQIKAILILFHGLNSTISHGSHIAKAFAEQGFEVVGFDHRGFGQSEGKRGLIESLDIHLADSRLFVQKIKSIYGNQYKYFVGGLSMGGMTSYSLTLESPEEFAGAILMAPAIQHTQNKAILGIINILGKLMAKWDLFPQKGEPKCHKSPEMTQFVRNDPNTFTDNMYPQTIKIIYEAMEKCNKTFEKYRSPFIIVQGAIDKLVDPDVGFDLMERSSSQDKEILYYENMWHDCWHEEEVYDFLPKIVNWACKRV